MLDPVKLGRTADRIHNPQILRFLVDAGVTIRRARVIAQKATTTAALALNRSEHIRQIVRIVTGIGHDSSAKQIRFRFIFAAELQKMHLEGKLSKLARGRAGKDGAQNTSNAGSQSILLGLGRLCRAVA